MRLRPFVCVVSLFGLAVAAVGFAQGPPIVHIGIVPSLMADLSDGQQRFISEEFPLLIRDFTGLPGQLDKGGSVKELTDNLHAGTAQFAVFQGIEFAEAQAANPDLQPLLLSVYRTPQIKALLVVKKDSDFAAFADLGGKDVAVLKQGKEHIRRYAQKESGGDAAKFFGKVIAPTNSEAALDDILRGKVQAAIVDNASFDIYRDVNPGKFQRLKVIGESALFPPAVIAYVPKKVDEKLVKTFRDGMLKASDSAKGREVMSTFKITSFTAVPAGYDKMLAEIRKAYPE